MQVSQWKWPINTLKCAIGSVRCLVCAIVLINEYSLYYTAMFAFPDLWVNINFLYSDYNLIQDSLFCGTFVHSALKLEHYLNEISVRNTVYLTKYKAFAIKKMVHIAYKCIALNNFKINRYDDATGRYWLHALNVCLPRHICSSTENQKYK